MDNPAPRPRRWGALEMEPSHNFWQTQLAYNSALVVTTIPYRCEELELKWIRVRGWQTRSDLKRLQRSFRTPISIWSPCESNLQDVPVEQHGLFVGYIPLDSHLLRSGKVFELGSPYQGMGQNIPGTRAREYGRGFPTIKFDCRRFARVIAKYALPLFVGRKRKALFFALLHPDQEGLCEGHTVSIKEVFFLPPYMDHDAPVSTVTKRASEKIHEELDRHYSLTTGSFLPSQPVQTADYDAMPRIINTPPQRIGTGAVDVAMASPSRNAASRLLWDQSKTTLEYAIMSRDSEAFEELQKHILRPLLFQSCATVTPKTAWSIFLGIIMQPWDNIGEADMAMKCLDSFIHETHGNHVSLAPIMPYEIQRLHQAILARHRVISHPSTVFEFVRRLRDTIEREESSSVEAWVAALNYAESCHQPMPNEMDQDRMETHTEQIPGL
ncbi:hypothetical protein K461DRAFT_272434 [Myriangium duriaei CBS 260.36]|uniref:Uncharacterized protein n=1 Tax=Myriangium duriaei CBS 260.36 TaxID=1168546 RepID=A0A9P4IVZ4_9PEZI|nr:hypothetical protein K461DRAFT_272434 [Myriangium duriaei CBS 260.36]